MLLSAALLLLAGAGFAQESRQDVSLSATGLFQPQVYGNAVTQNATGALGFLGSYRYMLTPRSAMEVNYSFTQNVQKYVASPFSYRIHSRMQEVSAAYVMNFNYKNFNPFLELGAAGLLFTPINDFRTSTLDAKSSKTLGGLYGAGIAYEISPSFDIRLQYRGIVIKSPNFGITTIRTNTIDNLSMPSLGVAYHF